MSALNGLGYRTTKDQSFRRVALAVGLAVTVGGVVLAGWVATLIALPVMLVGAAVTGLLSRGNRAGRERNHCTAVIEGEYEVIDRGQ